MSVLVRKTVRYCLVVAAFSAAPAPHAQEQRPAERPLEEVIITARKVSESAQDAPIAISVLNGDALADRRITNVLDLQSLAPSLSIGDVNGMAQISMRGIGMDNFLNGSDASVALHVDGAVVAQPGAQLSSFFDIDRVELVRGPQGTLYGRNSTGGAVNLVTRRPSQEFEGYGELTAGNFNALAFEGALSGPLAGEKLLGRLAVKTEDRDGYGINERTGRDVDDAKRRAVRAQLLWNATETLDVRISGEYANEDDAAYLFKFKEISFPAATVATAPGLVPLGTSTAIPGPPGTFPVGARNVNTDVDPQNDRTTWSVTGEVNWTLSDAFSIRSITNYRDFEQIPFNDLDGTSAARAPYSQQQFSIQRSQELQLVYDGARLSGLVGLYYFHESFKGDNRTGPSPLDPSAPLQVNFFGLVDTEADAVFANFTYDINDRLALNVGGRYSYEDRRGTGFDTRRAPGTFALISRTPTDTGDIQKDFTPRVGLEWRPRENLLTYASYSQGFKSGVIVSGTTTPILDPETVDAYELGLKSTLLGGTVQLNISGFFYDIADLHVGRTQPASTGALVTIFENAASAESKGADVELSWLPLDSLRLDVSAGYLDAGFERFCTLDPLYPAGYVPPTPPPPNPAAPGCVNRAGAPVPNAVDLAGNRLVQAPEWSGTLRGTYTLRAPFGNFTATAEGVYQDRIFFTPFNDPRTSQESVTRLNANVKFTTADERLYVNVWGRNLTDELVYTNTFAISTGRFISAQYAPPRTYGLTLGYSF